MDRKYQLEFCQHCENRGFSRDKGIICNLTGDVALFEEDCEDFIGDRSKLPAIIRKVRVENEPAGMEPITFPPKPEEKIQEQSINRSLLSMGFFILTFYLVFKWELEYILVLAGVLLIHELGHFLAMRIYKYSDLGIFFVPLVGAFATGTKETISQKQSVIILFAGSLPGVIIGMILYYFAIQHDSEFLLKTADIFVFLNLFNLLPLLPLDGGRIIKVLFFENNTLINKVFIGISIAVMSYYSISTESYVLLIIPFFLFMQFGNLEFVKRTTDALKLKAIETDKSFTELSDKEYWLIREEIGNQAKYYRRFITPGVYRPDKNEQKLIEQVKAIIQKKSINDLGTGRRILIILIWILSFVLPLGFIAYFQL